MVATKFRRTIKRRKPMRKNYARKKVYRRRNYARKPYTKISRMPVSDRYFTKLRYSETVSMTLPSSLVLGYYMFQSSVYDPDYTGAGHQPLWRDTLATMYNRYRVFGIKYNIAFKNTNVQQLAYGYVKHCPNNSAEINPNTLRERSEGKSKMLDANNGRTNYIRGYMSVAKTHGLSKREFYDDDSFIAAIGANPAKLAYLQIYGLCYGTGAIINILCDLEFYVEFMDRVDITGS